jgi:D-tagatose-1,6-bisphosphate aldolase subunit GatZ/KbaZ
LKDGLGRRHLAQAWPCFIVAQVGTDLHTTRFDAVAAARLFELVAPFGSLIKGHYSDWVENPAEYPANGMGGANVGPEFTAEEYLALQDLALEEEQLCHNRAGLQGSNFMDVLEQAVIDSGRWVKWLQPDERGLDFAALSPERRAWLAQTGSRYVWTVPAVKAARQRLYCNLSEVMPDPHDAVVNRILAAIEKYVKSFNLVDSNIILN